MALPGGPSDKLGNRYELWWTLSQLVKMLAGDKNSIRIEDPGFDKAEFVLSGENNKELHQAKRAHLEGKWTLATLGGLDTQLLQSIHKQLLGNNDRFVFASSSDAAELRELSDRARDAQNVQEFQDKFVKAKEPLKRFDRLRGYWGNCDPATGYELLRRIEIHTIDESNLRQKVKWGVQALFITPPDTIVSELRSIAEDSIHKLVTRDHLVNELAKRGYKLRRLTTPQSAITVVSEITQQYLNVVQRKLIRNSIIPRSTTDALATALKQNADCVLIGKAGSGKSACAFELIENARKEAIPVLAIRLDRVAPVPNTVELGKQLGLEESPSLVLAAAAADGVGVLVLDQLDAVSTSSGRTTDFLDIIEDLLIEIRGMRTRSKLQVVFVCRQFDWENDPRLKQLLSPGYAEITIADLSAEELEVVLLDAGFLKTSFSNKQFQLLRLPQNLSVFLDSAVQGSQTFVFNTAKDLFDRYWQEKRKSVNQRVKPLPDQWMNAIGTLCNEMTNSQQLSVPREKLDGISPEYLDQMASEGVLTFDGKRYGFGHESFFDYCYARTFVVGQETLLQALTRAEQHLFRRSQVRQVLAYLRDANLKRYETELGSLLNSDQIRAHIKELIVAFIAAASEPLEEEWHVCEPFLATVLDTIEAETRMPDDKVARLVWNHLFTSPSWFNFFYFRGDIAKWLASSNEALVNTATRYLRVHQRNAPDRTAELLEPYIDATGQWPLRLQDVMQWSDRSTSRRFFELFLRLVDNGVLDDARGAIAVNSTFWSMLYDLEPTQPAWLAEVIGHRLRRKLNLTLQKGEQITDKTLFNDDQFAAKLFSSSAAKAPLAFVSEVLPVVLEILDNSAANKGQPPERDSVWPLLMWSEYPSAEDACLESLMVALRAVATNPSQDLGPMIFELKRRNAYVANVLLLNLYEAAATRLGNQALLALCEEPWRFNCGLGENPYWYSMQLIKIASPLSTSEVRARLETTINTYRPPYELSENGIRRNGYMEFNILSVIPDALRSAAATSRYREFERKFGEPASKPRPLAVTRIESPIPKSAAEKMTDDQWLNAIKTYDSERELFSIDDRYTGGASELAWELKAQVVKDTERFGNLALNFPSDANAVYLERVLEGLKEGVADDGLKLQVCRKAYAANRIECGSVIVDVLGSIETSLPEDGTQMIQWIATEHPDPKEEAWMIPAGTNDYYYRGDILSNSINTTRGRAANAIGNLILKDKTYIERFQPTLNVMVGDKSICVLASVGFTLRAVAYHDKKLAFSLFDQMNLSDDRLIATDHVAGFIRSGLWSDCDRMRPLVERMVRSDHADVAQVGARLASIAALTHESASDLVEEILNGSTKQRLGLAEVAAANVESQEFRGWCEPKLETLFNDEDVKVRREAALCFRYLDGESLKQCDHLIEAFCESRAYEDDSFSILHALSESAARLPGITCLVCEKFFDRFIDEAKNIQTARAADVHMVAKLVFRNYHQHQDDQWTERCLNLIDRMSLEGISEARKEMEEFER